LADVETEGGVTNRKLRIAWAVAWGLIGLLLMSLCFALQDLGTTVELLRPGGPGPKVVYIYEGKLGLSAEPRVPYRPSWAGQINRYGFRYSVYSNGSWYVWGPLWLVGALLAAVAASVAALPWLSWRFSLRTLLIVATVVAVGLGVVVVVMR
jgi:hypothetical protein